MNILPTYWIASTTSWRKNYRIWLRTKCSPIKTMQECTVAIKKCNELGNYSLNLDIPRICPLVSILCFLTSRIGSAETYMGPMNKLLLLRPLWGCRQNLILVWGQKIEETLDKVDGAQRTQHWEIKRVFRLKPMFNLKTNGLIESPSYVLQKGFIKIDGIIISQTIDLGVTFKNIETVLQHVWAHLIFLAASPYTCRYYDYIFS